MEGLGQQKKKLLRINEETLAEVTNIVNCNPDKYASNSHFIRCATIRLIREEKANKRRKERW